ncbi:hypothetical protein FRC00_014715 [Tulasnella sp. 408]|nr:hypothetical protein FRC00_014715 [Tulasnella sp. 408]
MYLINHYLYTTSNLFGGSTPVPNKAQLNTTNAASGAGSLGEEALETCPALHGRGPTFLLVDFYEWGSGSVFEVAAKLNGIDYVPKAIAPVNGTDGATSTGSTSSSGTKNGAERMVAVGPAAWLAGAAMVMSALVASV